MHLKKSKKPYLSLFSGSCLQSRPAARTYTWRKLQCTSWFVSAKYRDIPTNTVGVVSAFTLSQAGTEGPLLGFVFLMSLKLLQISVPQHWILQWKLVEITPFSKVGFFSFPDTIRKLNQSFPFLCDKLVFAGKILSIPSVLLEPSWHPQLMAGLNFPRSNSIAVQLCRLTICSLIVSLLTAFSGEQFERSGKPCFGDVEVFSHLKCNFTPCVAQ